MKKANLAIILLTLLGSACTKQNDKPTPKFFDGVTLPIQLKKSTYSGADSLTTAYVVTVIDGTQGSGQHAHTFINCDPANHIETTIQLKAVDSFGEETTQSIIFPKNQQQLDYDFQMDHAITSISIVNQ